MVKAATTSEDEKMSLVKIEEAANKYSLATIQAMPRFERAIALARGITEIRGLLMPLMPQIVPLMGTRLGFKTDKDGKESYPISTVCDCVIEATIRGLQLVGNQFNIISGSCYTTKEGYTQLLANYPGLTDLKINLAVPTVTAGGAKVVGKATWRLNGVPNSLECEIPVRMNAGSGADQVLGKANRKIRARIWEVITGSPQSGIDGEVDDPPDPLPRGSRAEEVAAMIVPKTATNGEATKTHRDEIAKLVADMEMTSEDYEDQMREMGIGRDMTAQQADSMIAWLKGQSAHATT